MLTEEEREFVRNNPQQYVDVFLEGLYYMLYYHFLDDVAILERSLDNDRDFGDTAYGCWNPEGSDDIELHDKLTPDQKSIAMLHEVVHDGLQYLPEKKTVIIEEGLRGYVNRCNIPILDAKLYKDAYETNKDVNVYIAVGYLFREGKLLLVYPRRFKKWIPMGGQIDYGQDPVEYLKGLYKRLIKIEPNISVKNIPGIEGCVNNVPIVYFDRNNLYFDNKSFDRGHINIVTAFYCTTTNDQIKPDRRIISDYSWFDLEELNLLDTPDIVKHIGKSIIERIKLIS